MIDKNVITSAVSPLKRKKSYKGGTKIKKAATKTAKRHGGFGKSTATSNKAARTATTTYRPIKGESASGTTPQKPYSFDKDGDIVVNNYLDGKGGTQKQSQSQTQGTEGYWTYKDLVTESEHGDLESYKTTWDRNDKGVKDTYPDFDDYVAAAKEWWKSDEGKAEKEKRKKGKTTKTKRVKDKFIPGTSGTQDQTQEQKT